MNTDEKKAPHLPGSTLHYQSFSRFSLPTLERRAVNMQLLNGYLQHEKTRKGCRILGVKFPPEDRFQTPNILT